MLDVNPRKPQPEHVEPAEKLRQGQDEFRQIVDLIPQTIVVLNPDGKAIYANRVVEALSESSQSRLGAVEFGTRSQVMRTDFWPQSFARDALDIDFES